MNKVVRFNLTLTFCYGYGLILIANLLNIWREILQVYPKNIQYGDTYT